MFCLMHSKLSALNYLPTSFVIFIRETTPAPSRPGMAVPGMGISADTGKPNGPSPFH